MRDAGDHRSLGNTCLQCQMMLYTRPPGRGWVRPPDGSRHRGGGAGSATGCAISFGGLSRTTGAARRLAGAVMPGIDGVPSRRERDKLTIAEVCADLGIGFGEWGGWDSDPGPADYESGRPAALARAPDLGRYERPRSCSGRFRHVFGMIKGGLSLGKHQQAGAAASSHQPDACSGSPTGTTFKPSILSKSAGLQV